MKITLWLGMLLLVSQIMADSSIKKERLATLMNQNVYAMNAIVKRGDYKRLDEYNQTMQKLHVKVEQIGNSHLIEQMNHYDDTVLQVSISLQKYAPDLNQNHHAIISGLKDFNRRVSSIGLAELIQGWRTLGNLKKRFVRSPSQKWAKDFNAQWLYVNTLITELYLDEEYETPLFEFLELYKHTFESMAASYKEVGFDSVAALKPLSYEIKSTIIMMQ